MNIFNKKLCGLLIFNLFLIFSFCCSSYGADSTPDMSNLENYSYKQTIAEATYELINSYESQSNVIDGTFYYFILPTGFSNGAIKYRTFLFNKSILKDFYFRFSTTVSNDMYQTNLLIYFNDNINAFPDGRFYF